MFTNLQDDYLKVWFWNWSVIFVFTFFSIHRKVLDSSNHILGETCISLSEQSLLLSQNFLLHTGSSFLQINNRLIDAYKHNCSLFHVYHVNRIWRERDLGILHNIFKSIAMLYSSNQHKNSKAFLLALVISSAKYFGTFNRPT